MSVSFDGWIYDATVASGGTVSRGVKGAYEYSDAVAIGIQSPATMDATTWTIEVSQDDSTYATLKDSSGTAIGPPGAGSARQYTEMLGFKFFRIKSSGATAADRTFKLSKLWTV